MRIRVARQHAKLSQAQLAERLEISRGAVANWESVEDTHPAAARLIELAITTNVSVEWLLTGRGRMLLQTNANDIPAVDGELIYDSLELRLLRAFRSRSERSKLMLIKAIEADSMASLKAQK